MELKSTIANGHCQNDRPIQGFVKFDIANVYVPGFGSCNVKSEYPRLKPKFEREHVDVEELCDQLLAWVTEHFETFRSALLCVYTTPQLQFQTKEMNLWLRIMFWLWLNDEVIEKVVLDKNDLGALQLGTDQIHSILTGKHNDNPRPEFKDVPNYPIFRNLFYSLLEWHNICRTVLPEYENLVKTYANDLKSYFTAMRWYCVDQIDGRYSEQSFKTYRRTVAFVNGFATVAALINGVKLTDEMANCTTMNRVLEIANGYVAFSNDMLGMKKEFENGEKDNLIVFMVLEKRIPLQVAVRQVCDFIASELADYVLLRQAILHEFNHDENLIRYLDILDSIIDGHNVIYMESTRHCAVGSLSLTR